MKAAAGLALGPTAGEAATAAVDEALGALGEPPSLALVFASPHHAPEAGDLVQAARALTGDVPTIGCIAQWVIGGDKEVEQGPAVSALLVSGTGPVETFTVDYWPAPDGGFFSGYSFAHGGPHLMLCDPVSFPAALFTEHLNQQWPGNVVAGGVAAAGDQRHGAHLFIDGAVVRSGAVGLRLPGVQLDLLVAQGCRPIGSPFTVTGADGNVMRELGGRSPLERLQEMVASLPERDRSLLASGGLHLGRVIDEYRPEQRRGDFLVRNVLGVDPASGAIVVGDQVEVGQTVQFHLRDAESAHEDLRELLEREAPLTAGGPGAALVFTCNGRGSQLFGEADHDAGLVAKVLGGLPAAGCFCAGELGPVGGRNFLHGFTASIAVLRPGQGG
jgi:small ligand-binding sensory domain FIST